MRDERLGAEVNLIEQNHNSPSADIYTKLLEPIVEEVRRIGQIDFKYNKLENIVLNRTNVKKSIMTKPYNASIIGMRDQLASSFEKIKGKSDFDTIYLADTTDGSKTELTYMELYKIAEVIYNMIYSKYPSLKLIYNYFINMAKVLNKLGLSIT